MAVAAAVWRGSADNRAESGVIRLRASLRSMNFAAPRLALSRPPEKAKAAAEKAHRGRLGSRPARRRNHRRKVQIGVAVVVIGIPDPSGAGIDARMVAPRPDAVPTSIGGREGISTEARI